MAEVEKQVLERERLIEDATQRQIRLEEQLIGEMKQEYHQKIGQLEREKEQLLKEKEEGSYLPDKNKLVKVKMQTLEGELKDYRKKAIEQKKMQKLVDT